MERKTQVMAIISVACLVVSILCPIYLTNLSSNQIAALQTQIEDLEAQIEALTVEGYTYVMEKNKDHLSYGNTTYVEIAQDDTWGNWYIHFGVKDKYILRLDGFNQTEILLLLGAQDFYDELIEGHIAIVVNVHEQRNFFTFGKYKSRKMSGGVDFFGTSWDRLPNNLGYFPESFTDEEINIILQYMDDFFKAL